MNKILVLYEEPKIQTQINKTVEKIIKNKEKKYVDSILGIEIIDYDNFKNLENNDFLNIINKNETNVDYLIIIIEKNKSLEIFK